MKKVIETVPNFSEGRDEGKIEKILAAFQGQPEVKLLDYERDGDHNRLVVTAIGEPEALRKAIMSAIAVAVELIDLRHHRGQHPRMGAVDVIPLIPIKNVTMEEVVGLSKELAREVADTYGIPVFLYEESATEAHRKNLADIRKGQFEGMGQKLKRPEWKPDFGRAEVHPSAGVVAIGARMPLVAFNVNLDTSDVEIAKAIAKAVRHINGGLRFCRAIGVELKERGLVQVSMNMTDFSKTPLYRAVELVRAEARRYGVNVVGSEVVGMVPAAALIDTAVYYMGLEHFSMEQVLELRMME